VDASPSPSLKHRIPVFTLLIAIGAVAVATIPGASSELVYDRTAILSGEVWRMFTGYWVHFSTTHLLYDLTVMIVAGCIIEVEGLPHFGWLCLLTPWIVSASLLVFEPQLKFYGGLSVLATTALVYLALCGLHETTLWRWISLAILLVVVAKTIFEISTGHMVFLKVENVDIVVSATGHFAGIIVGVIFYGWAKIFLRKKCR
jgi:rhomboid family GlyGly-CTERM serine protease